MGVIIFDKLNYHFSATVMGSAQIWKNDYVFDPFDDASE